MIAVIGGAGLVGSHIVDALLADEPTQRVVVVDDLSRGQAKHVNPAASLVQADLTSPEALDVAHDADVVFLTAARWLLEVEREPAEAARVNALAPHHIALAMRDGARLVFSSSASVYGEGQVNRPMRESDPVDCSHLYAATKVAAESLLASQARRIDVTCLRYANIWGLRMDGRGAYMGVLAHWMNAALRGEPIKVMGAHRCYDFVGADAVAKVNLRAAESAPGTYNVCSGVSQTLGTLAKLVAEVTGGRVEHVPDAGAPPPVTRRIMDASYSFAALGIVPTIPTTKRIADLWAWWQAEHGGEP